jgi:hypothetical protein
MEISRDERRFIIPKIEPVSPPTYLCAKRITER